SCKDTGGNNNLPHGMISSRILKVIGIYLTKYPAKIISSTYDNRASASMGYVFSKGKWHKNVGFKPKLKMVIEEIPSRIDSSDSLNVSIDSPLKDAPKIKENLDTVVDDLHQIQTSLYQVASATANTGEE
ncbi:hypothetical protein HAX54_017852, partial [Datura stramonium]|nr:hypothetical protein [Datura stramonium]